MLLLLSNNLHMENSNQPPLTQALLLSELNKAAILYRVSMSIYVCLCVFEYLGFCFALFNERTAYCKRETRVKQMLNKPQIFIISRVLISYLLQMANISTDQNKYWHKANLYSVEYVYENGTHKKRICLFELTHIHMKTHTHINNYVSSMFSCLNKSEMCTIYI